MQNPIYETPAAAIELLNSVLNPNTPPGVVLFWADIIEYAEALAALRGEWMSEFQTDDETKRLSEECNLAMVKLATTFAWHTNHRPTLTKTEHRFVVKNPYFGQPGYKHVQETYPMEITEFYTFKKVVQ